jgi:hypothetical protein
MPHASAGPQPEGAILREKTKQPRRGGFSPFFIICDETFLRRGGEEASAKGSSGANHMLSARKLPTSRSSRLSSDPRIPLPLPKTLPRAGESGWQFSPLLLVLAEVSVEGLAVPVGLGLCFGRVTHDNIWRNFCSTRNCFFWYWNQNCRRPVLTHC